MAKSRHSVLKYSQRKASQATVKRQYEQWRQEQGLPHRCDNETCRYYTESLTWNGKTLPVILDHREGVNSDNRPESLQYLCPNCDSQLPTQGGRNRGMVKRTENSFQVLSSDRESWNHTYFDDVKLLISSGLTSKIPDGV